MGGSHTDVLPAKPAAKEEKIDLRTTIQKQSVSKPTSFLDYLPNKRQELEIHKNDAKGEVHFHDRLREMREGSQFKAAVPVAIWWEAWNALKNLERTTWSYVDTKNGMLLTVTVGMDAQGKLDASTELEEFSNDFATADGQGDTFKALDKFTTNAGK